MTPRADLEIKHYLRLCVCVMRVCHVCVTCDCVCVSCHAQIFFFFEYLALISGSNTTFVSGMTPCVCVMCVCVMSCIRFFLLCVWFWCVMGDFFYLAPISRAKAVTVSAETLWVCSKSLFVKAISRRTCQRGQKKKSRRKTGEIRLGVHLV